ncbi:MAG: hypothetical protein WC497_06270 [Patescibacteria group bacterium]
MHYYTFPGVSLEQRAASPLPAPKRLDYLTVLEWQDFHGATGTGGPDGVVDAIVVEVRTDVDTINSDLPYSLMNNPILKVGDLVTLTKGMGWAEFSREIGTDPSAPWAYATEYIHIASAKLGYTAETVPYDRRMVISGIEDTWGARGSDGDWESDGVVDHIRLAPYVHWEPGESALLRLALAFDAEAKSHGFFYLSMAGADTEPIITLDGKSMKPGPYSHTYLIRTERSEAKLEITYPGTVVPYWETMVRAGDVVFGAAQRRLTIGDFTPDEMCQVFAQRPQWQPDDSLYDWTQLAQTGCNNPIYTRSDSSTGAFLARTGFVAYEMPESRYRLYLWDGMEYGADLKLPAGKWINVDGITLSDEVGFTIGIDDDHQPMLLRLNTHTGKLSWGQLFLIAPNSAKATTDHFSWWDTRLFRIVRPAWDKALLQEYQFAIVGLDCRQGCVQ